MFKKLGKVGASGMRRKKKLWQGLAKLPVFHGFPYFKELLTPDVTEETEDVG